jgi:hypothetical protein
MSLHIGLSTGVATIQNENWNYKLILEVQIQEPGQRSRCGNWLRVKNVHFSMWSRPDLGLTQHPIYWVPGALSPGNKAAGA